MMVRLSVPCSCEINEAFCSFCHLVLNFYPETFSGTFVQCFPYWLHWHLLLCRCCEKRFYHWLITLHMKTDRRVSFDWWILAFCHVKYYQPWRCWNLLFWTLVEYWVDLLLVGSWMGQSLRMFYQYVIFCAWFWILRWKSHIHVYCCCRGEEVDCHKYFIAFFCKFVRSEIGVGILQRAVMGLKLAVRSEEVMVSYSVYGWAIKINGSHWQKMVMQCLRVVMYFYGHLLVIMEIKIMRNLQ